MTSARARTGVFPMSAADRIAEGIANHLFECRPTTAKTRGLIEEGVSARPRTRSISPIADRSVDQPPSASTNSEICVPLSPTAGPSFEVQCTLPGHGRRLGWLAGGWASAGRTGCRGGQGGPRSARRVRPLRRGSPLHRPRLRTKVAGEDARDLWRPLSGRRRKGRRARTSGSDKRCR